MMVASLRVFCVQTEDIVGNHLAVRARGITKCFDDVVALEAVDLDVVAGQIHGLVGPNGAGKTTLLGLLLGLAVPDRPGEPSRAGRLARSRRADRGHR